jgi:hypothetical protein
MLRSLPWVIAFVLVIGAGVVQGLHTDRWVVSQELTDSAIKLEDFPDKIGTWECQVRDQDQGKDEELDDSQKEMAGIVNYKKRTYRDSLSGKTVNVLIMCGRTAHMAIHTPDICFKGDGAQIIDGPQVYTVPKTEKSPSMQFNTALFKMDSATPRPPLCVYWAWTTDGVWSAPKNPRWTFASKHALFKMYVTWEQVGYENAKDNPQSKFLKALLEKLHEKLSPVQ